MTSYDQSQAAYAADVVPPPTTPNTLASPTQIASGQTIGNLVPVPSWNCGLHQAIVIVQASPQPQTIILENIGAQSIFISSKASMVPDPITGNMGYQLHPGEEKEWITDQALYALCIGRVNYAGLPQGTNVAPDAGDPGSLLIVNIL